MQTLLQRLFGAGEDEEQFALRAGLLKLQAKNEAAQQGADIEFHEAALLDGLMVAGMPFARLYRDAVARSETTIAPWKRLRRAQRAYQLARYAEATARLPGNRIECGVLFGLSALIVGETLRALDASFDGTGLYLVDSFEGLSAPHPADAVGKGRVAMGKGHFGGTSVDHVQGVMAAYPRCQIVKGWIPEVLDTLPESPWVFVHLDIDLYEPTLGALEYFLPRLAPGAVVVNDDYGSALFPGAGQAWDEFFRGRGLPFVVLDSGQAVFVNCG
jgi:O-methyltransferase